MDLLFSFLLNGKKNKNWCLYNRRELFSWQSARVTPPSWIRLAWISVFPRVKSSHKPCCPTSHLGATLFCKLLWMIYTHCTRIFFLANLKHKLSKYLFYFIDIQLIITYLEKKINHNISGKKIHHDIQKIRVHNGSEFHSMRHIFFMYIGIILSTLPTQPNKMGWTNHTYTFPLMSFIENTIQTKSSIFSLVPFKKKILYPKLEKYQASHSMYLD